MTRNVLKSISAESTVDVEGKAIWTIEDALMVTGFGRYNICLAVVCSLCLQAMALDLFGPSFTVAAAVCDLGIDLQLRALLTATPMIGVVFGSSVWGFVSDRYGRRHSLVLSMAVGFMFSTLSSLAPGWKTMAFLKLMSSAFTSASNSVAYTLIGESCGRHTRTRPLLLSSCALMCAHGVAAAIAYPILKMDFSIRLDGLGLYLRPWRLLVLALAFPSAVSAALLTLFYESPKFLMSKKKSQEALRVLRKIYSSNSGQKEEYFVVKRLIECSEEDILISENTFLRDVWRQTSGLLQKPLLSDSLRLFYIVAVVYMTASGFILWLPYIVNSVVSATSMGGSNNIICSALDLSSKTESKLPYNVTTNAEICDDVIEDATLISAMLYGALACFANLLLSLACERKKRLAMLIILGLSTVSSILINIVPEVRAGVMFYFFFMMSALCMGLLSVYFVDLYPTGLRGTASCLSVMVGRSMAFVGVNAIGALITTHCELTFYFWSMLLFSALVCSWFLPEDGKTADET